MIPCQRVGIVQQVRCPAVATAIAVLAFALSGCGGAGPSGATVKKAQGGARRSAASRARPTRRVPSLVVPASAPVRNVHVPVLTYHRVASLPAVGQLDLIVDPASFVAELAALHRAGFHPIGQAQLFDALYRGTRLPAKPIMISVDDGYVDDVRTILPALRRWHMVASFFVITGRTTEPGFMTSDQIRALDRAGMDVGDHTAHHVDLRLPAPRALRSEIAGSRRTLEALLNHPVYSFAYPFGAFNDRVLQAVHAAGFVLAYTTAGGTTESTSTVLSMPRLHVGRAETPSGLVSLLGGA